MVYLTRRERFSAAHRLFNPGLSDQENAKRYGACSNPNWHGHNYVLWVTVKGDVDQDTGYVVDLKALGTLIRERVINKLDHKNINLEVDFMKGLYVSTENLAVAVWNELKGPVEELGISMHCVKIEETENNFVEYFGD